MTASTSELYNDVAFHYFVQVREEREEREEKRHVKKGGILRISFCI